MPAAEPWTVSRALNWCCGYLERHDDENPRLSAEWLLSGATGLSRVELYAYFDRPLSAKERGVLRETLRRRGAGEPLQYISGEAAFRHIVVHTARGVLIPRPETELLVQVALERLDADARVLEVGTGTGCVALSLAKEAGVHVTATDIAPDALSCARRNCEALGMSELVDVVEADCADGVAGPFDALVSNPPYIPSAELESLPYEVAGFEPYLALDGGKDGLAFFDRLLAAAPRVLGCGALFACELHETRLDEAARRLEHAGFQGVETHEDMAGRPRVVSARLEAAAS